MMEEPNLPALPALLFHIALWHLDLGYLCRGLHHGWPQHDAGIVLWSLSVAANDWQPRERLSRMCTIPINGVLDQAWDTASFAMEAQILRPLLWFGLLEHREEEKDPGHFGRQHLYRKTALFDRFLSFDVTLENAGGHDTDQVATLPTDRIPTAARGSDAADCQFTSERPDSTQSSRLITGFTSCISNRGCVEAVGETQTLPAYDYVRGRTWEPGLGLGEQHPLDGQGHRRDENGGRNRGHRPAFPGEAAEPQQCWEQRGHDHRLAGLNAEIKEQQ